MDSELKKEIDRKFSEHDLAGALGVAGGFFSMCWTKTPKGVFKSTEAGEMVVYLTDKIDQMYRTTLQPHGPIVDAHSVKSGLYDPKAGDPE